MTWKEDYPENARPANDAEREIHWVQGGIPIARQKLVQNGDNWKLGPMEYAYFGGTGVELCYWAWALDNDLISNRHKRAANEMANDLEQLAASLRRVAK